MPDSKAQRPPLPLSATPKSADTPLLLLPGPDLRNAITLPNSPLRIVENSKPKHKSKVEVAPDRQAQIARIKSLGKMDIRSPVLPKQPGSFGLSPHVTRDDQVSLYTTRTNRTIALRLLSFVPTSARAARTYYDDFTTIDWANAYMLSNKFAYEVYHGIHADVEKHPDLDSDEDGPRSFLFLQRAYYDLSKWLLIVVVAFFFSIIAYTIDKFEVMLVGLKYGYCRTNWFASMVTCCAKTAKTKLVGSRMSSRVSAFATDECPDWISWSSYFDSNIHVHFRVDYFIYVVLTVLLALMAGRITLTTKIPSRFPAVKRKVFELMNNDDGSLESDEEDFSSPNESTSSPNESASSPEDTETETTTLQPQQKPLVLFTAAGSGVPEVKTILSGFVLRRFLGTYTLFAKTAALILAIASGMALGKEGPYVHLATCVGNICTRWFPYINNNEYLKKEILSASASSGVALAFGSPLGGVLFILEEINNYLPSNQLFLIFFCAITSTLFLKFLNPYGTNKTVLFELNYTLDWRIGELPFFVIIGIAGGIFGAAFIKFTKWWPKFFRQRKLIKDHPLVEIACVSLLTGLVTFWNPYTKQNAAELVLDLATSCTASEMDGSLCPQDNGQFLLEIYRLFIALVIKIVLTFITFGIKVPCGIYVPSMVAGALFGRLFAMIIRLIGNEFKNNPSLAVICSSESTLCVDLGIYSMISAGAFMAGVTRMNITLATILFELTSSYTYVLPIAIAIAVANWMGRLLEENSLYECLLIANDYPFMSPEKDAVDPFTTAKDLLSKPTSFSDRTSPKESLASSQLNIRPERLDSLEQMQATAADVLGQRTPDFDRLYIDISHSPYVSCSKLQGKLKLLAKHSLLDGCIALVRNSICVGTIYFSNLEFCLDKVQLFSLECDLNEELYCKVYSTSDYGERLWESHDRHNKLVLEEALELRRLADSSLGNNLNDYFNYGSNSEYLGFEMEKLALSQQMRDLCDISEYVNTTPIFLTHDSPLPLVHLIFDRIGTRTVILQRNGKYYGLLHKKAFIDFCRRSED